MFSTRVVSSATRRGQLREVGIQKGGPPAGRIYRVGILMYGKKATLPEIVKWIRYA